MAFEFNAILNFKAEGAVEGMKKAQAGFAQFKDGAAKANASFSTMMGGAAGGAVALAPLSAGFGLAIKDAAEFEHGLAAVQSTMLETKDNMHPLAMVTKQLGAATKFSAVEATQGAMYFAQAGFDMKEIISALPGAMDAAAAGDMNLAATTDIMASSMGAFGIEAKRAGEVADVLALAASLTNTDMLGLGEGLKYSASTARTAGMTIQDTATALGILSNAGLKGSMGGTALQAALIKLTAPTKEVLELFGGKDGFNAAILDAHGKLKPFEVIMANMQKVVQNSANPLEAAGKAAEIFGLRGAHAFGAFAGQVQDTVVVNDIMLERFQKAGVNIAAEGIHIGSVIPKLVALRYQINGAEGAAKAMAEIRMSSFLGSIEQLKGATQGLSIEVGELMMGSLTDGSRIATDAIGMLAFGFQALTMTGDEVTTMQKGLNDKNSQMYNRFGAMLPLVTEFAFGFKTGITSVIDGLKAGFVAVKEFFGSFSDAGFSARQIGELAAKIILVGAIVAPILAGIAAFAFVMGPLVAAIGGFFGFVGGIFEMIGGLYVFVTAGVETLALAAGMATAPFVLMAGVIIGLAVVAGIVFYNMMGGIDGITMAVTTFGEGFMSTFGPIMDVLITELTPTFEIVKGAALQLFDTLFGGTSKAGTDFSSFGQTIGTVAGFMVSMIIPVVNVIATMAAGFISLLDILATAGKGVLNFFGIGGTDLNLPDPAAISKLRQENLKQMLEQPAAPTQTLNHPMLQDKPIASPTQSSIEALKPMTEAVASPDQPLPNNVLPFTRDANFLKAVGGQESGLPVPPSPLMTANNVLGQETVQQSALVQPPSAMEMANAFQGQQGQSAEAGGGGGQQTVKVIVEGRIRGQDLNIVQTKSQIEQSQLNGRSIGSPIAKRRAVQNGSQFTSGG